MISCRMTLATSSGALSTGCIADVKISLALQHRGEGA
jgi:hypothetical protein